jgi:desulfoferrodoxin (superoxide reductase-like protein)
MTDRTIGIHNAETGEFIERPMTQEEYLQWESDKEQAKMIANKELETQEKRKELLNRLGITEEEAKLLLS